MNNKRVRRLKEVRNILRKQVGALPLISLRTGGMVNFHTLLKSFWNTKKCEPKTMRELLMFRGFSEKELESHGL